jgi:hypothetical protein
MRLFSFAGEHLAGAEDSGKYLPLPVSTTITPKVLAITFVVY